MELGEKLRQARLAAGLSQRQLCGDVITRNMLSQIENGGASPSMSTLRYLAERLHKPVSFFLEEEAVVSTNQRAMENAWAAYERGDVGTALEQLKEYRSPDPVYDREHRLLRALTLLTAAEKALKERRNLYARELLEQGVHAGEVYGQCGYGDYANFFRAFKTFYGVAPGEYGKTERTAYEEIHK